MRSLLVVVLVCGAASAAHAKRKQPKAQAKAKQSAVCADELRALGVSFTVGPAKQGVDLPVTITGPIGGVTLTTWDKKKPLYMDCSLAVSLARSATFFADAGVTEIFYSGIYSRRNVRGTNRPSRHSFALAIDIHRFHGGAIGKLTVEDDYEQGLGDDIDCIGKPLTDGGRTLRTLYCRLARSEEFRLVLTPDTDADHYNHFHMEALPWQDRAAPAPAAVAKAKPKAKRRRR